MELRIDGIPVQAEAGVPLAELVRRMGLDSAELSRRPLAAKIGGEVFTLNYVPERRTEPEGDIRRAIAVSGGEIRLLRYADAPGKDVYTRTAWFVVFLSLRSLWPEASARTSCTMGNSVFFSVENCPDFCIDALRNRVKSYIEADIPITRRRLPKQQAMENYLRSGQSDKAKLLRWHDSEYCDEYVYQDFSDCFYGELLPSAGYLTVWSILPAEGGFILTYPDDLCPDRPAEFRDTPHFFAVFSEGEQWGRLMECETVSDLNRKTADGTLRELIRVNEALHEKRFSGIADMVCQRNARVVMLAGPSSSGKTTSANRLATQLRVHGRKPILLSLDNYYIDRDRIPPGPDGTLDLEHINTLDTELFRKNVTELLSGQETELPTFNFLTGKREWRGNTLKLTASSVIIVEGIHGLNPVMIPDNVGEREVFKLFVNPLLPLNMDNHNLIPTTYLRLLRRIVRDYENRGSSVQHTISMWDSVQQGEKRWILPYQENADVIFNSSTLYELAVLKKHIFPLLTAVTPEEDCYDVVKSILKVLNYICEAEADDEIPPTGIIREFIGGNTFYR